jgi:hypothetical protein
VFIKGDYVGNSGDNLIVAPFDSIKVYSVPFPKDNSAREGGTHAKL